MTSPVPGPPHRTPTSSVAPSAAPTRDARESVVAELSRHFAEDRLSLDEFDRRAELAYSAPTLADLEALTADVGGPPIPHMAAPERIVAIFSNQERGGSTLVPRRQAIRCIFGNVELDLRLATFAEGVSEIDVSSVFGNVEITVPAGVRVEVTGGAILGSFGSHAAADGRDAASVLRISGRAVLGNVEVRHSRVGAAPAFPSRDR